MGIFAPERPASLMHEALNHTMDAMSHSTNVNPSNVFHDRARPLSNNSGHCLENHTGSHLEDEDTVTSSNMLVSHSTSVNPSTVFHDGTRPILNNSGHCLENDAGSHLEDEDIVTSSNMDRNSTT
jgi:hypothetical protein